MHESLKIVIIEDDYTLREGYKKWLEATGEFVVVNTYSSAEKALLRLEKDKPELILLDIGLPGMSGIDAVNKIKEQMPQTKILILTVYDSEEMIFNALKSGVGGFITKDSSPQKIIASIRDVMSGGGSMSSNVAQIVMKSFYRNQNSLLSKREREILTEIANGKNKTKIAEELFIHTETVKSHIKNIYAKLEVHSKADAIRTARENKLL